MNAVLEAAHYLTTFTGDTNPVINHLMMMATLDPIRLIDQSDMLEEAGEHFSEMDLGTDELFVPGLLQIMRDEYTEIYVSALLRSHVEGGTLEDAGNYIVEQLRSKGFAVDAVPSSWLHLQIPMCSLREVGEQAFGLHPLYQAFGQAIEATDIGVWPVGELGTRYVRHEDEDIQNLGFLLHYATCTSDNLLIDFDEERLWENQVDMSWNNVHPEYVLEAQQEAEMILSAAQSAIKLLENNPSIIDCIANHCQQIHTITRGVNHHDIPRTIRSHRMDWRQLQSCLRGDAQGRPQVL